ncbi:MAG: N-acetyltransferase [Oceanicaulis sp.]|uniref:GNAT family N-acetyltransferase n=1 Tax=Glycocaulis sp. TaxID=1969725 RepID=UPI0025BE6C62|nr:GNAT family N-acetyltransferase [Glycocaulis sp.]MCC5981357.1 N-acetyltransferase [Oceanicaulis sp.]MCH8520359.1 GNAT family N-acetyltransferase [Glycocaulis sp.]
MADAPEFTITEEVSGSKGRYVARAPGMPDAEMTYSVTSPTLIIIDHTGVPDEWRGMGVGKALVERGVTDARARGVRIVPLCPFAKAQIARNPEWQDVLA